MTSNSISTPSLASLLAPAAIQLHLAGADRDAVLRELVQLVPALADLPEARERLFRALVEREQLHSTGIGDGVAIPHARNALVGLVDQPLIAFGRHDTGVPYEAIDGAPARLFFLLIAPTVTQHLAMLARLSRMLRDPRLRQALLVAATAEDVREQFRQAEAKLAAN